jgi:branched-chain amino acid transport system permease protein
MGILTKRRRLIICILIGIGLVLLPHFIAGYILSLIISILIISMFVASINLLTGYGGRVTLGHSLFWGSAGYIVAILATRGIVENFYLVTLIGILATAVMAAILGPLILRVPRLYFLIITFALANVFFSIAAYSIPGITGGSDGLTGIVRPDLGLPWSMESSTNFYYLVLVVFAIIFFILYLNIRSPFGKALLGIRDNEHRMVALGYNIFLYRYICFIVSAMIAGVSGILYVYFDRFVSPSELHWLWAGDGLLMALIGGLGTFWGPVPGALVFVALRYWVSAYTMYWASVSGVIFVLVVLYFRGGVVGFIMQWQRRLHHRGAKG